MCIWENISNNLKPIEGCEIEKSECEIMIDLRLKKLGLADFSMCVNPENQGLSNQLLI